MTKKIKDPNKDLHAEYTKEKFKDTKDYWDQNILFCYLELRS
jgi:hypothetical protein